jgi:hypothetical protein
MSEQYQYDTQSILAERILPEPGHAPALPSVEQVNDIEARHAFGRAMGSAFQEGWMPQGAMDHMGRLLSTNVYTHDGKTPGEDLTIEEDLVYDKEIGGGVRTFDAFVSHAQANDPKTITRAFVEVMAGDEFAGRDGDPTAGPVVNRGLEQVFGYTAGGQALNRAVAEHYADGLLYGDIDATDPSSASRQGARHIEDRTLLHVLAEAGDQPVDVRLFGAAFFEDKAMADRLGDASAQAQFEDALAAAFPFTDVVKEISELEPKEGQSPQEMIADYAVRLEKRAVRHRKLPTKIASLATRHLAPRKHS